MRHHGREVERVAEAAQRVALHAERPAASLEADGIDHGRRESLRQVVLDAAAALQDAAIDVLGQGDEARRHELAPCFQLAGSAGSAQIPDLRDPVAANADVGREPRVARAVEHAAAANHDVDRFGRGRRRLGRRGCGCSNAEQECPARPKSSMRRHPSSPRDQGSGCPVRSRNSPSCATDATSSPACVKIEPRTKPRAPAASGLSMT